MKNRQEVLKALREFFEDQGVNSDEKDAVWDILTGLRGPDTSGYSAKEATTAVIRERALGHDVGMIVCADFNCDQPAFIAIRRKLEDDYPSNHFRHHAQRAFRALDLKWDELNTQLSCSTSFPKWDKSNTPDEE